MKIFCFVILQLLTFKEQLLKQFTDFQDKTGRQVSITASIRDVSDRQQFFGFNQGLAVSPASTQKLITTATALLVLGEDFRFRTLLQADGPVISRTLRGNLIVSGNGDPTFGSPRNGRPFETQLNEWIYTLKKLGISKIEGQVIIDGKEFDTYDIPGSWFWGDMGNYYGAIPLDINLNENFFTVYFNGGQKVGEPAAIHKLVPMDEDWKLINQVKTGEKGSGDQVNIYTTPLSNTLLMKGTVPAGSVGFPVKGAIPNPPALLRKLLMKALADNHITVENKISGLALPERHLLEAVQSIPLKDLIAECNYYSINLYADALAKAVCRSKGLEPTFTAYELFVKSFWLAKGIDLEGFEIEDGSGLSPSNAISAEKMTLILEHLSRENSYPAFFRSVPVVGQHGTVAWLDKQKKTRGMVRAKSGSISKTRSYAGYFNNRSGKSFCFMINVSRYPAGLETEVKTFLENILINLIDLNQ